MALDVGLMGPLVLCLFSGRGSWKSDRVLSWDSGERTALSQAALVPEQVCELSGWGGQGGSDGDLLCARLHLAPSHGCESP